MTGFELRTSGIGIDHSTNWVTTTAHFCLLWVQYLRTLTGPSLVHWWRNRSSYRVRLKVINKFRVAATLCYAKIMYSDWLKIVMWLPTYKTYNKSCCFVAYHLMKNTALLRRNRIATGVRAIGLLSFEFHSFKPKSLRRASMGGRPSFANY